MEAEKKEFIVRLKDKTKDFTIIYNECFKNNKLSMQAMGLFAYLMTLPNDWEIHKDELVSHFSNGRDAVIKAFDELIDAGYIVVEEEKREKGRFARKIYKVYETSSHKNSDDNATVTEKPYMENRHWNSVSGKPLTENPTLLNTNNTKDLLQNTNNKTLSPQPIEHTDENSFKNFERESRVENQQTDENSRSVGDMQRNIYTLLVNYNKKQTDNQKKIPIANSEISFIQSDLAKFFAKNRFPEKKLSEAYAELEGAVRNFVGMLEMPDNNWQVHSWNAFVNNYTSFLPEFYTPERYKKQKGSWNDRQTQKNKQSFVPAAKYKLNVIGDTKHITPPERQEYKFNVLGDTKYNAQPDEQEYKFNVLGGTK